MNTSNPCKARRQGDELHCSHCNVRWGVDEDYVPPCQRKPELIVAAQAPVVDVRRFMSGLPQ